MNFELTFAAGTSIFFSLGLGKLQSPKSELLETLYGFDGQHYGPAEEGLGYASDGRDWHEETPMAGVSREEEHLLRELDNGESELYVVLHYSRIESSMQ